MKMNLMKGGLCFTPLAMLLAFLSNYSIISDGVDETDVGKHTWSPHTAIYTYMSTTYGL